MPVCSVFLPGLALAFGLTNHSPALSVHAPGGFIERPTLALTLQPTPTWSVSSDWTLDLPAAIYSPEAREKFATALTNAQKEVALSPPTFLRANAFQWLRPITNLRVEVIVTTTTRAPHPDNWALPLSLPDRIADQSWIEQAPGGMTYRLVILADKLAIPKYPLAELDFTGKDIVLALSQAQLQAQLQGILAYHFYGMIQILLEQFVVGTTTAATPDVDWARIFLEREMQHLQAAAEKISSAPPPINEGDNELAWELLRLALQVASSLVTP